jgi:hypothetical protein
MVLDWSDIRIELRTPFPPLIQLASHADHSARQSISGSGHGAGVGNLPAADSSQLIWEQGYHCQRFSVQRDKLNFIPLAVMSQDDRANITALETVLG